ncbi:hypothetical protein TNCV_1966691 [Trichonephila clavipes]|nr:hypothetical protein TNCV_1966691 [Trichonephila clavipes]
MFTDDSRFFLKSDFRQDFHMEKARYPSTPRQYHRTAQLWWCKTARLGESLQGSRIDLPVQIGIMAGQIYSEIILK